MTVLCHFLQKISKSFSIELLKTVAFVIAKNEKLKCLNSQICKTRNSIEYFSRINRSNIVKRFIRGKILINCESSK